MPRLTLDELHSQMATTITHVADEGARIIVTRGGEDVAALVSPDDLALIEAIEDRMDLDAAREALAAPGENMPALNFWKKLGL